MFPISRRGRPGRVLVIDDEAAVGDALRRVLSPTYDVDVVSAAHAGLALLASGARYDVIFCDVVMPLLDGIGFHRRLAVTLPAEAKRIVFMTGGPLSAAAAAFFEDVSNVLLDKPLDIDGLCAFVEQRVSASPE